MRYVYKIELDLPGSLSGTSLENRKGIFDTKRDNRFMVSQSCKQFCLCQI